MDTGNTIESLTKVRCFRPRNRGWLCPITSSPNALHCLRIALRFSVNEENGLCGQKESTNVQEKNYRTLSLSHSYAGVPHWTLFERSASASSGRKAVCLPFERFIPLTSPTAVSGFGQPDVMVAMAQWPLLDCFLVSDHQPLPKDEKTWQEYCFHSNKGCLHKGWAAAWEKKRKDSPVSIYTEAATTMRRRCHQAATFVCTRVGRFISAIFWRY